MALNGLGRIGYVTTVTGARNLLFIATTVPLLLRFGYNGVPAAYLLAGLVSIPLYVGGYGAGGARRLLLPLAWVLAPVSAGVAAGMLTGLLRLDGLERAACALLAMLFAFGTATWLLCPPELLPLVRSSGRAPAPALPVGRP
jgi:hypothetical protein